MNSLSNAVRQQARRVLHQYSHRLAGRMLTVFPEDRFIVSYPKSGNTWVRFLVASLMSPGPIDFLEMEYQIAMIYGCTDASLLKKCRPRVLSSHEYFDPRYRKLIYAVRDPRDVVLSSYHHHLRLREIPDGFPFDLYVSRWSRGEAWGRPGFGTWSENALSWIATRQTDPGFLLVRYEDLQDAPQRELTRVAEFMGLDASPRRVAQAVEFSSAERLRNLEKQQHEAWGMTRGSRPDVPFIGTAAAGGWKSTLSRDSVKKIESACGAAMELLGYEFASKSITEGIANPATAWTKPQPAADDLNPVPVSRRTPQWAAEEIDR